MWVFLPKQEGGARMKRENGLALLLSAFAIAFVCVLLSGAGRLVGREEMPEEAVRPVAVQVCLTVSSGESREAGREAEGSDVHRGPLASVQETPACRAPVSASRRDANGNVLRGASYLRTVYQAFALGDGFA